MGRLVLASESRWDKSVPAEKQIHVGFYSLRGGERDRSKAVHTDVLELMGAKFLIC